MRQLIQLRWVACFGQLVAILIAHEWLGVPLPVVAMLSVVGLLVIGNLLFTLTLDKTAIVPDALFLALLLDMSALTAQLYLSGGVTNPFISLYLLQIVLGAILLRPSRAWLLVIVAAVAFIFLSIAHLPLTFGLVSPAASDLAALGQEVAFIMVAVLLVLFITRISRNLRARDAYVAELRQRAAEEDSIVRMGLFASGAAHELGTPLSSLSVLVADWQRDPALAGKPELAEELSDARAAVERCRDIVSDILDTSGQTRGEPMGSVSAAELVRVLENDWSALHEEVPLQVTVEIPGQARVPDEPALRQALWSLLENAGEVSPQGIALRAHLHEEQLVLEVADRGPGFSLEQLAALGEIVRSRKGAGHGLGLFLATSVARRLGGGLEAFNREGGGACVRMHLPLIGQGEQR
ncbi:ATP-binding protein [Sphingomonas sp. KRR8]|uniref:ATP-binding protein n=1 Tax=Sphingomonas sp. KRR8 TaxID=2942996 RepID=UPI0020224BB4|nr:ATP-binding protein [Sphingomonas sp. KRR8]URD60759.1 ATP-binding protein [Sphingomonas sp. KRR8]